MNVWRRMPGLVWMGLILLASTPATAHPPQYHAVAQPAIVPAVQIRPNEEIFFTPEGAAAPGLPGFVPEGQGVELKLTVAEAETNQPIPARVNVIGHDGRYYEPDEAASPLATYSLHRTGNREGKGPFRYYGWFFYTDGQATVRVPHGPIRVEVWKGFEYEPVVVELDSIQADEPVVVTLHRVSRIAEAGYVSGDPHLHFTRDGSEQTDRTLLTLLAAEDIRMGFTLAMNIATDYIPHMNEQVWPQAQMGRESVRRWEGYQLISAQEYRVRTFGHILLLGHERLVPGQSKGDDPNHWPVFGIIAEQARRLGGISAIHAHGGYNANIYAEFPRGSTDGVELLQFADYRAIGLEGWYHMLDAGFRFPATGNSDYPYCRVLGDCRTYVRAEQPVTMRTWLEGMNAGRSFFTTGPLVLLEVEGHHPGDVVQLDVPQSMTVAVDIESPVGPVRHVQLIVNGQVARHETLTGPGPWRQEWTIDVAQPSWLAVRVYDKDPQGRENLEAHTNPIYFEMDGMRRINPESVDWLIGRLDVRIRSWQGKKTPHVDRILEYYRESRDILVRQKQRAMEQR